MKRFKIKFLAGAVMVLALGSCKKQLDKFPANAIALEQSFESVRDAKSWNTALYAGLRGRFYGGYAITQDVQGDQLNATLDFGNRNGPPHRWEGFEASEGTLGSIWLNYYRGIANANLMIDGFQKITPTAAATAAGFRERGDFDKYKGDAHFVRAYYYLELITRYAKPYEPGSANSDLGVPILLGFDVNLKPSRATVKAVYDQILADLAQAKTYFNQAKAFYAQITPVPSPNPATTIDGIQGATTFTIDAANALEARIKLQMQDWAGAKSAADAVIATGRYPLITTQAAYTAYWYNDTKQEDIMQLFVANTTETPNTMNIYIGLRTADNTFRPDFLPSQWVIDKYAVTDLRKSVFFASKPGNFTSGTGPITVVNKFPGNPTLFTAATTNYQHAPKFLRIAEMYLISAEAGARGAADADALIKLNALRVARGLLPLVGLVDNALFAEVKEERFRELAFEGFRLWDLKRWHEGFTRSNPQNTNFLTVGAGYTTLSIPADHPKFVWAIPSNDVTINPNLQQNPGW